LSFGTSSLIQFVGFFGCFFLPILSISISQKCPTVVLAFLLFLFSFFFGIGIWVWLSVYNWFCDQNYFHIPLITHKNFGSSKKKKKKQFWCDTYCTNVKLWSISHIFSIEMVEAWSQISWLASMHMPCRMDIVVPFQVRQKLYYFLKCHKSRKLRSFLADFFKNYYLLMLKFHRIQDVVTR
jgi:hypothetical protein